MSAIRPLKPITPPADELWLLADAAVAGRVTPADADRLNALIESTPDAALFYAAYLDLHADLAWRRRGPLAPAFASTKPDLSPLRAKVRVPRIQSAIGNRQSAMYSLAAATLLLAAAVVAIYLFAFNREPETRNPKPASPVATLIETTPGSTLTTPAGPAFEGGQFTSGSYALDTGSAELMLINSVNVKLRGNSRLRMYDETSVALDRGRATFVVPKKAVGFTVHLPDGAKIVDLGTAFTAYVSDDELESGVTVLEGSVRLEPADGSDHILELGSSVRIADRQVEIASPEFSRIIQIGRPNRDHLYLPFDPLAPVKPEIAEGRGSMRQVDPGLSHPTLASSAGGAVALNQFAALFGLEPGFADEKVVYLSALMRMPGRDSHLDARGAYRAIELFQNDERVYSIGLIRSDGDTGSSAIEHRAYVRPASDTPTLGPFVRGTVLLIVRLEYAEDGRSMTIDAWVNPTAETDLDTPTNRITIDDGAFRFNRIGLKSASDAEGEPTVFDELRISDAAPELRPADPESGPDSIP